MVEAIYATSTYIDQHVVNILTPIHCLRYVRKDPFAGNVIVIEKNIFSAHIRSLSVDRCLKSAFVSLRYSVA